MYGVWETFFINSTKILICTYNKKGNVFYARTEENQQYYWFWIYYQLLSVDIAQLATASCSGPNQLRTMASEIDPIDWPLPRTVIGRTPWATTTPRRLNRKFTLQPAIYVHMYIWRICGTGRGWMTVFIFFVFHHAWKLYTNTTHTKIKFYISYIIFFPSMNIKNVFWLGGSWS